MFNISEGLLRSDPDELSRLAHQLAGEGKVRDALHLWQEASKLEPKRAEFHLYAGHALFVLNLKKQAESAFRAAAAATPAWLDAQITLADFLGKQGQQIEAIERFKMALSIAPDQSARILLALGNLYLKIGDVDAALENYERVVSSIIQSDEHHLGRFIAMLSAIRTAGDLRTAMVKVLRGFKPHKKTISEQNRQLLAAALHAIRIVTPIRNKIVEARQLLKPRSEPIAALARQHRESSLQRPRPDALAPNRFWAAILAQVAEDMPRLNTAEAALLYLTDAFNINLIAETTEAYLPLYIQTLKAEFPHLLALIDKVECSPYLSPDRLISWNGKLVSSTFFNHLRSLLCCLTWINRPSIVCEIGSGYGGLALLWMTNPHYRPDLYVLIDFPESLFFAEIFIRANDPSARVLHLGNSEEILAPGIAEQYDYILCPSDCASVLGELCLDVVVNMFSFQEMKQTAIDYWMNWLDTQNCRYFYSLNIFGLPLARMDAVLPDCSLWSPRLSNHWTVRLRNVNPAPLQSFGLPLAELIAEKTAGQPTSGAARPQFLTREALVEELLQVQQRSDPQRVLAFVQRWVAAEAPPREVAAVFIRLQMEADDRFKSDHADAFASIERKLYDDDQLKYSDELTHGVSDRA